MTNKEQSNDEQGTSELRAGNNRMTNKEQSNDE